MRLNCGGLVRGRVPCLQLVTNVLTDNLDEITISVDTALRSQNLVLNTGTEILDIICAGRLENGNFEPSRRILVSDGLR